MKILIYSTTFYPNIGGIEILTFNLAKAFKASGHEVLVITKTFGEDADIGISIIRNPTPIKLVSYYHWADVFYMPNLSLKITWLLLFNPFKKWVISHNTWYFDEEHPNYIAATLKQLFLFKATNISVSHVLAKSIWANCTVIHNCYDDALFKNEQSTRNKEFLFVGRLVSSKGLNHLIEAFNIVIQLFPTIHLTIVGKGPEELLLKTKVYELKISHAISFVGAKSQEEIVDIMNSHQCVVVPSVGTEAFGIVVIEALACGCMVISSDSTGLIEAGDQFSIRYHAANIQDIAFQMKLMINSNFTPNYTSDALTNFLNLHQVEYVAKQYLNLFA